MGFPRLGKTGSKIFQGLETACGRVAGRVAHGMSEDSASIPLRWIGPIRLIGPEVDDEVFAPLATLETPLWPSVARGARVTARAGGIRAVVVDERMARSILLEAPDASASAVAAAALRSRREEIADVVARTSRFARLVGWHDQVIGSLLFLRLEITTGDAAGHNMVTKAAEAVERWVRAQYPALAHVSVSGNYCCDKKVSAVNGILGRGRYVVAEARVPTDLCRTLLRADPDTLVRLHVRKNLVGSITAGSLRSANAHFANVLLAFYLATGQDAANIVEGSQGIVHADARDGALYFSCTLPNLVVGTTGAGKNLPWAEANLERLGCRRERPAGANARRLAVIAAAAVLCGELSLLAALANEGELMRAHLRLERGQQKEGGPLQ